MKKLFLLTTLSFVGTCFFAYSQLPELELELFSEGYSEPLDIANCGDGRLFIVERAGKIWISDPEGNKSAEPFIDMTAKVNSTGGEQGLLGLAFHPNYVNNGLFYVNYINAAGNTKISRFNVSAGDNNKADPLSEKVILKVKQPFENHNGGCIKFGPDGYLYIGLGDGGDAGDPYNNAQNPGQMLGKFLRIDVDSAVPYAIPSTNPFINTAGYLPEIWALGVRNPFRWSFDRLTGDLWIGDVGQNRWEEVNLQPAGSAGGQNYGWDCKEGDHKFRPLSCESTAALTDPIAEYPHDGFDCTVIGGFVYRGTDYPNMYGKYIYTDFCSGRFRTIFNENGEWSNLIVAEEDPFAYVSFGEDSNGELYVANNTAGVISRVIDVSMKKGLALIGKDYLSVFPNPSTGQFTLIMQAATDETYTVEIRNLMGQLMYAENRGATKGNNEWTFNTTELTHGTYYLVARSDYSLMRTKISIQ